MKYCRHCGAQMDDLAVVCVKCGIPVNVNPRGEKAYCWHCGKEINSMAAFCTGCGVSQVDNANMAGSANGMAPGAQQAMTQDNSSSKHLHRVREGKRIAGVCTGIAERTETKPWLWQLLFILFGCCIAGIVLYIIMVVVLDYED